MAIKIAEKTKSKRGRPKSGVPPKMLLTLRVDPEIIAKFKDTGEGWRTRMSEALRKAAGL